MSGEVTVDFPFIMERLRRLRAKISPADAVHITAGVGADVYQGRGVFTGPNTIEVNGKTLNFKKAVVATGGSPRVLPLPHCSCLLTELVLVPLLYVVHVVEDVAS